MISKDLNGGATEADGRVSAPVGPSVATPLSLGLYPINKMKKKY